MPIATSIPAAVTLLNDEFLEIISVLIRKNVPIVIITAIEAYRFSPIALHDQRIGMITSIFLYNTHTVNKK